MWHITKRELYDNLNSLRFALATILLLGLMLINAVVAYRGTPCADAKISRCCHRIAGSFKISNEFVSHCARGAPGYLYKKPSSLHFCADGGNPFLAERVHGGFYAWATDGLAGFWQLDYMPATLNSKNIRPDTIKIDWAFVIGYGLESHRDPIHL